MVPPEFSTPMGNPQSVPLRSNSGLVGGQSSHFQDHTQYDNVNVNVNASSIMNQSFGNSPRGEMDIGAKNDSLDGFGNPQYYSSVPKHTVNSQHFQRDVFQHPRQSMSHQSPRDAAAAQINEFEMRHQRLLQKQQRQYQYEQQQQQLLRSRLQQKLPAVGICARRITEYMHLQKRRPQDNNIEFWKKFVCHFFAPNAKMKCCVSLYKNCHQTAELFSKEWHCEMCKREPARGFEAAYEILPRLFKVKYESGIMEELLYIDMPNERHNYSSGQIILAFGKAVQRSVFENLRVVRDGQLRIVFSPDLKIRSWEFCARGHEEVMVRSLLMPQVCQLGDAAEKFQASTHNRSSDLPDSDIGSKWTEVVASARGVTKALEVPSLNEFGFTKGYMQCLQIAEVVNTMKDLIDFSLATGTGPIESLAKRRRMMNQNQHYEQQQQQMPVLNSDNEQSFYVQAAMSDNVYPTSIPYPTSSMMNGDRASLARNRGMGQQQQQQMTVLNSDNEQSFYAQAAMSDNVYPTSIPYATSSMMNRDQASLARNPGMGQHQQQDPWT